MPNLVGLFQPGAPAATLTRGTDAQLARVENPYGLHNLSRLSRDGFAAALLEHRAIASGPQPALSADGRRALFLDGEIFNRAELRAQFLRDAPDRGDVARLDRNCSDASLCLALLERNGASILRAFNGLFAIAFIDLEAGRLQLISDRFGFRPLFYAARPGHAAFATELKAVAAGATQPLAIDAAGLVELLSIGSHVGETTWLADHRRIGPASIVTVDRTAVSIAHYWHYQYDEGARRVDQQTYVVNSAKLLDRAVERQIGHGGRPALFLSGGYDSRAIAASIRLHHLPLPAYTFGRPTSRDARIAPLLAERLGLRHALLGDHPGYLYAHCRQIAKRTDGMLPFHRTTSLQHHDLIAREADILVLGFLGELSGSHTWPRLLLTTRRDRVAAVLADRITAGRGNTVGRIFRPEVHALALQQLRERLAQQIAQIDNEHPLNLADAWRLRFLHPRTSYQATAVDRDRFEIRAPHIDADLVDFQLTIPPYARIEQRVYKQVIASSFPTIRDVPCANNNRPIDPGFVREYARMVVAFAGRGVAKAWRQVVRSPEPIGREITDYAEDFRAERPLVDEVLQPLLARGVFDEQVFNPDGIRAIIDEHYRGTARHEELLGSLIAWGLAADSLLFRTEPSTEDR